MVTDGQQKYLSRGEKILKTFFMYVYFLSSFLKIILTSQVDFEYVNIKGLKKKLVKK